MAADATLARILRQGFALVDAFSAKLGETLRNLVSAWPLTRANRAGLMRQIDGVLDRAMGWSDPWVTGSGGSGFYAPGAAGFTPPRVPFVERLDRDVFAYNPDRLVILGGLNDLGYEITSGTLVSVSQFSQRVADTFALIRQRAPSLPVAQLGLMQPGGSPGVRTLQFRDALIQRCAEYGVTYVDNIGGPTPYSGTAGDYTNKGWVTGAGNSGATQTTGNASRVTGPDGTHPTQYGHTYLGLRAATALRTAGWT